jgi:SAM-dependent methyltransferase
VPRQELPRVLREIRAALRRGGILFSSNPHGRNDEGWRGSRYGAWHDLATWQRFLDDAGFDLLTHYYRPPGLPREQQPWLATIARRRDA